MTIVEETFLDELDGGYKRTKNQLVKKLEGLLLSRKIISYELDVPPLYRMPGDARCKWAKIIGKDFVSTVPYDG